MASSILDTFQLTPTQRDAATFDCDLAVGAGAGSGKTNALTARYLRLIEQGRRPRGVTAITFTDRGGEMRNRVRQHVHDWLAKGSRTTAGRTGKRSKRISTPRGMGPFTVSVRQSCAAHPAEAEVDPRFEVLEEGPGRRCKPRRPRRL